MFLSRNNKNNVYPCKPQFYYIKVGLQGSKLYRYVFVMTGPKISYVKVSDKMAYANSADPDQTVPTGAV